MKFIFIVYGRERTYIDGFIKVLSFNDVNKK